MAYRLVMADGRRRLAICALDNEDMPIPDSVVPLSDYMQEAGFWHADPRFFTLEDRLFLHFNNGDRILPNDIFLVELDPDRLLPRSPPQPLRLAGQRRRIEKNWMLFSPDGKSTLAVYSIKPHIVLSLRMLKNGAIDCHPIERIDWTIPTPPSDFGEPRGGTPPIRVGDVFYSFFHIVSLSPLPARITHRLRHRRGRPLHRYHMGFYGFAATPPYRPICFTPKPILVTPPRLSDGPAPLNRDAERVIYPSGALFHGEKWTVSAGLNDERCCLLTFDHSRLLSLAKKVE
jgi:hypothetical protein